MAHKLKNVTDRLDAIAKERQFHLIAEVGTSKLLVLMGVRPGRWLMSQKFMEELRRRRANEVTGKQFRRSLYLCYMWNGNFDLTIWICVSDDSTVEKLTRAMKESIRNSPCDIEGLDN